MAAPLSTPEAKEVGKQGWIFTIKKKSWKPFSNCCWDNYLGEGGSKSLEF